jgi:hypothetical protein
MKITVAGTGYVGLSNAMLLTFIKKTMVLQMVADQWIATSLPLLAMTAGIRHCERSAAIHAPSRHCERSVAIHAPGTVIASAARQSMSPAPSLRAQRGNPCLVPPQTSPASASTPATSAPPRSKPFWETQPRPKSAWAGCPRPIWHRGWHWRMRILSRTQHVHRQSV